MLRQSRLRLLVAVLGCAGARAAAAGAGAPDEQRAQAVPAPSAGTPTQTPVQRFEPTEVTAEAVPPSPVSVPAPPPAPLVPARGAPARVTPPLTMDEILVSASNARVTLNMFGDPAFVVDSTDGSRPEFVLSPLNFLLYGQSGKLVALSELAFELGTGGERILVDVERFFVGWHDERFSLEAGRTHTELGYWNNAFHHGSWLQMTVNRPRIVNFEDDGGLLPIHSVGVTARLHLLTGERQLDLVAAVANGRGNISDDIQVTGDDNAFKSLLLKLETRGFGARNLRFGVAGYYDQIAPVGVAIRPALPDQMIQEAIGNAFVAYRGAELTLITEAYEIVHLAGGQHFATFDAFLLLAYRFGLVSPYAVGEVRAGDIDRDPFFFPGTIMTTDELLGRFKELTVGLRFDINTWSAIKVEYRATLIDGQSARDQRGIVDWSFGL
jgi:hypothetical protein